MPAMPYSRACIINRHVKQRMYKSHHLLTHTIITKQALQAKSHLQKGQDVTFLWCLITGSTPLCRSLTLPLLQGRPLTSSLRDFHSAGGKPALTNPHGFQLQLHCAQMQCYRRASAPVKTNMPGTRPLSQTKREISQAAQWSFFTRHSSLPTKLDHYTAPLDLPIPVFCVHWCISNHENY